MSNQKFKLGDRIVMVDPEGSFDAPAGSLGTVTAANDARVTIVWDNPGGANFVYPRQIELVAAAQATAPEAPTPRPAPAIVAAQPAPFKLPHAGLTNACAAMINAATALREAQAEFDRARDALAAMFPRE